MECEAVEGGNQGLESSGTVRRIRRVVGHIYVWCDQYVLGASSGLGRRLDCSRSRTCIDLDHVLRWWIGEPSGPRPDPKCVRGLTWTVRHARRVSTNTKFSQCNDDNRSNRIRSFAIAHRSLGAPENLSVLAEPISRPHHPPPRPHDEFSSSSFINLDHDSQAMGHPLGRLRRGPRPHLHPDLHRTSAIVPTVAPADRDCHLVLSHLGRDHLYAQQQGHRGRHGSVSIKRHV